MLAHVKTRSMVDCLHNINMEILIDMMRVILAKLQNTSVLLDFSPTVKAAPHECIIMTNQPKA